MSDAPETQHYASLPVHPVPKLPDAERWSLVVGDGERRLTLDSEAIARLPHVELVDRFTCLEGWSTDPLRRRGVLLSALLDALGGARRPYVAVAAGDFRAVLKLEDLPAEALLADGLDGRPLPREHGGPLRLVIPGGVCYQSVKWVQRIDLQDSDAGETAAAIARARGSRRDG